MSNPSDVRSAMRVLVGCIFATAALAWNAPARATFVIELDDGLSPKVIVADQLSAGSMTTGGRFTTASDAAGAPGVLEVNVTSGIWTLIVSAATSKPAIGPTNSLSLLYLATSFGPGTLKISYGDDGYTEPPYEKDGNYINDFTVSMVPAGGSNAAQAWQSPTHAELGKAGSNAPSVVLTSPGAGSSLGPPQVGASPFSLTGEVLIMHAGVGSLSSSGVQTIHAAIEVATSKDQCRREGWRSVFRADGSEFRDQGDCIQYVTTGQ